MEGIIRNHEPQFHAKGVALRFAAQAANGERVLSADPDKLSQAVINLLSNALKFTPAGGQVEVQVASGPEGAEIRVADSGVGIGPEDLPRIFERFYRVDSSRNRATGGVGIGLSIAKAIVEAHGGTISAASQPGRGSEFRIRLPELRPSSSSLILQQSSRLPSRALALASPMRSRNLRMGLRLRGAGVAILYPAASMRARMASLLTASG